MTIAERFLGPGRWAHSPWAPDESRVEESFNRRRVAVVQFVFSFVFPFLLVMFLFLTLYARWRGPRPSWRALLLLGAASLAAAAIPCKGLPAARWLASVHSTFSIPLTALLLGVVWKRAFGTPLFSGQAVRSFWIFGLAAGIFLYPMALGIGRFDPYALGWGFSWFFVAVMLLTLLLLLRGNRFGIVLMASAAAYLLNVLESPNFWDYLVDPLYALISAGAVLVHLARGTLRGKKARRIVPASIASTGR